MGKEHIVVFRQDLLNLSETFIKDQCIALKSWQPFLIGRKYIKGGLHLDKIKNQTVAYLGKRESFLKLLNLPNKKITASITQINPKLIHIHFATDAVFLWPSIKRLNIPTLITLHGYDITTYKSYWTSGQEGLIRRFYPSRLLKLAYHPNVYFIAVSEAIKKCAIDYGIPQNKIFVSYIGLDIEKFKPSPIPISNRPKEILFVGRFVEKKAPLLLIQAFSTLARAHQDFKLTMIGEGPLLDEAKKLTNKLNISVEFLGACSNEVVAKRMKQARVFCLPSIRARNGDAEGFGIVILEAMASGTPVVTSAWGGAGEGTIHAENGYCFKEGDIESLAMYLHEILTTDDLAERFSYSGIKRVQNFFDNKLTTKHLESIYSKITGQ